MGLILLFAIANNFSDKYDARKFLTFETSI